ncbi:hypothetical protein [Nonlabens xiamenensis]|uniref:hypothetical protein n=1 Tax=Nonlabens xiamenensis TaxID=2341043 RepID=UPI000F613F1C|nr:hypothetical protein [Nonlabens xiamenensis]
MYTVTGGTVIGKGQMAVELRRELTKQFLSQQAINSRIELIDGVFVKQDLRDFDMEAIAIESFLSIDLADAYIGKLDIGKLNSTLASTCIDITPDELSVIGFSIEHDGVRNKGDGMEISVDLIFGFLSEFSDSKITKLNYKKTVRKLISEGDKATQSLNQMNLKHN